MFPIVYGSHKFAGDVLLLRVNMELFINSQKSTYFGLPALFRRACLRLGFRIDGEAVVAQKFRL